MQPARKPAYWETTEEYRPPATAQEEERPVQEWEIKLGKTIFYLTVAMSIWFFYWLNGIQCPC